LEKILKRVLWVLFLAFLLLGIPRLAGFFADQFNYSGIDPDGVFAWISVRHIFQALVFLAIMILITRAKGIKFGFSLGDKKIGLFYVRLFTMIFGGYLLVSVVIILITGSFPVFDAPLTSRNIFGYLGFQLFLSGPSEELIFRAFAITMLGLLVKGRFFKGKISTPNIIAAVIFGLAHLRIEYSPFAISYDLFQLIYATGLGIVYGVCYEQSKSMIYPMIMHSITNVFAVGVTIIAAFLIS